MTLLQRQRHFGSALGSWLFWRIANALKLDLWWFAVKANIVNVTKITKFKKYGSPPSPGLGPLGGLPPGNQKKKENMSNMGYVQHKAYDPNASFATHLWTSQQIQHRPTYRPNIADPT